ncbi:MAG: hypothetical protein JRI57_06540 [Deltaproteobacteria bacterium]|nr:hypothetical protein [Deltaproteobacteria bacterium]MBW2135252.1 hypothetical protein [Deltaproteobacteria bacterium]
MQVFIMHVGHPGNVDIDYTVTRQRNIREILDKLPKDAPERHYFENDSTLHSAFPNGSFNCWGVPPHAEPAFGETRLGDLILIIPQIGIHDGGIHQIGIVKAKAPLRCYNASRILWPRTPRQRLFPFIFFFTTEIGFRGWFEFLEDLGYNPRWNPRGWYKRLDFNRFAHWGGPEGYLNFLRTECGFRLLMPLA